MEPKKIVVVGDEAIGKTCMLLSVTANSFAISYVPTVFDDYSMRVRLDKEFHPLAIYVTAGSENYSRLRTMMYPRTDIFLICFSVVDPNSFDNIKAKWLPEIKNFCSNTPFLLVGTQMDLRGDPETIKQLALSNQKPVSRKAGAKLAKKLKAAGYAECSAKTQECLLDVFKTALRAATKEKEKPQNRLRKMCTIL